MFPMFAGRLRSHTASAHKVKISDYKKRFGVEVPILETVYHRWCENDDDDDDDEDDDDDDDDDNNDDDDDDTCPGAGFAAS